MIKSMTGFGRSNYENNRREYLVEIRSVNNRFTDINVKMPRSISYLEEKVKKIVANNITRGKIEVFITFINNSESGKNIKINSEFAKKYVEALKELAKEIDVKDNINIIEISKLPDVVSIKNEEDEDDVIWKELSIALEEAITNLIEMRKTEGNKIKQDLESRIETIKGKLEKISELSTGLVADYIVKLKKRISEILKDNIVDDARLAQEIVIYSDKCSVEEEITRLKSHIFQFINLLDEDIAVGKKIDFLIQEMNRETNTIGSKANKLEITNLVIDMKTELENVREQIQNIE